MTTTLSVHIIDDDDAIRDSMALLLRANDFTVHTHTGARGFFEVYRPEETGCILVDMLMPEDLNGDEVHDRVIRLGDAPPIIVVTGHPQVRTAVDAMKRGAVEFLEKPVDPRDLIEIVRKSMNRRIDELRKRQRIEDAQARIGVLTPRERDVLRQLLRGRPNKIIARELGLSPRTVEIHRARVMEKTGAGSLPLLVKLAMAAGLDPEPSR
jgi:two-component system, LuxR family, response regulator FixJ